MGELLGCFHYFSSIIRAVVNVLSLCLSIGPIPIIETTKLKEMCI